MKIIKWRNKFSGDTGFVKSINKKEGHFVNTFEQDEAKSYSNDKTCATAIKSLHDMGEAENNEFEIVTV